MRFGHFWCTKKSIFAQGGLPSDRPARYQSVRGLSHDLLYLN
jgi:hypothetical protein